MHHHTEKPMKIWVSVQNVWNTQYLKEKKMKICIGTPKGELIFVNLDWKKGRIQSRTMGGVAKLREYGWNILKKGKA